MHACTLARKHGLKCDGDDRNAVAVVAVPLVAVTRMKAAMVSGQCDGIDVRQCAIKEAAA